MTERSHDTVTTTLDVAVAVHEAIEVLNRVPYPERARLLAVHRHLIAALIAANDHLGDAGEPCEPAQ